MGIRKTHTRGQVATAVHPLVLVVEDDPMVRLDMALALSDAGFAVVEVPNAAEALEVLETRQAVGVVFADMDMPGPMEGQELTHVIARRWPDIAVLVTSGYRRADAIDPRRFFSKPYDSQAVISRLQQLGCVVPGQQRQGFTHH